MSSFIRSLLKPLIGKKRFQTLFEKIHYLGLLGMNYNNAEFETNGELHLIQYLRKQSSTKTDMLLFDVGANVGNYAANLLESFGNKATIYCFEPSHLTFQALHRRFEQNPQIRCFHTGMGEENAQLMLYSNKDLSGFASVYQRDLAQHQEVMNQSEEVSIQTLDNFCNTQKISHIDFLKLDVEGHELAVLKGAKQLLKDKKIASLQFEFGGSSIDSRAYFRDFWNILNENYHLYRVVRDGLQPIQHYSEKLEVFAYTNFFAALK